MGRHALRLPCGRHLGSQARRAVQPVQVPHRPARQRHRRAHGAGSGGVLLPVRHRGRQGQGIGVGCDEHGRFAGQGADVGGDRRPRRVQARGRARPPARPVEQNRDLRAARQGVHRRRPVAAGGAARHLRRSGAPHHALLSPTAGRDLHRAAADPGQAGRAVPAGARRHQLLGILHAELFRAGALLRHPQRATQGCGSRAQGGHRHGARPARGGLRGHHGRGVQPHLRGRCGGTDRLLARLGHAHLLPTAEGQSRPAGGHDRLRQHAGLHEHAGGGIRHRLAAVLGQAYRHRRLPIRPGRLAGAPGRRVHQTPPVPVRAAQRSAARQSQDHHGTVGSGQSGLAHRPVRTAVRRMERSLPRYDAHVLGLRRGRRHQVRQHRHAGDRHATVRFGRSVRHRPRPRRDGVDQLRVLSRRVHAHRSDPVRRQTQRGQRGEQHRRLEHEPFGELRRGGPERGRQGGGQARAGGHEHVRHAAALARHADAAGRRRVPQHAGGQQQRLLPRQRHHLAELGLDAQEQRFP